MESVIAWHSMLHIWSILVSIDIFYQICDRKEDFDVYCEELLPALYVDSMPSKRNGRIHVLNFWENYSWICFNDA